ncbi:MAG: ABC transporter ATP-binding protein [Nitrososphaerales archaeon]
MQISHLSVLFKRQRGIFGKSTTVRAVNDISFEIRESEIVSLVGESGSGKTTVARCIMRLASPTSGSIFYNGVDILSLKGRKNIDYLRDVQMIFQDPFESLNSRHDVFTTISIPLRRLAGESNHQRIAERVRQLLSEAGLNPDQVMYKLPHELSGGERQRVSIARALASDPKLLVADEPITMLDASQRLNILSLLMELKEKRNLTILIITHDLASAKAMSDRTAVIYLGNLVEIGPTESSLSKPHHPYTELILSSTPRLTGDTQVASGTVPEIEESMTVKSGCVYFPRCKYATEICKTVEPELLEKSRSHFAACHNALNV